MKWGDNCIREAARKKRLVDGGVWIEMMNDGVTAQLAWAYIEMCR